MSVFDQVTVGDIGAMAVGGVVGGLAVEYFIPGSGNLMVAGGVVGGSVFGIGAKRGVEAGYDWAFKEEGTSPILLEVRQVAANLDARLSRAEQEAGAYLLAQAAEQKKADDAKKTNIAASIERQQAAERAEAAQAAKDEREAARLDREERKITMKLLAKLAADKGENEGESATSAAVAAAS